MILIICYFFKIFIHTDMQMIYICVMNENSLYIPSYNF